MAPGIANPDTPSYHNEPAIKTPDQVDAAAKYLQMQEEAEDAEYSNKSTGEKILRGVIYGTLALTALFLFMIAIKLIGDGFQLALGCSAKGAFDFADNPIAGLMIGTITTALLHSSSTVTSITVALVGSGGMTIRQGVFVVMGANIGTCVTCIMVAFGQVGDRARFERAMAAATVHDMYNIWSVFIMFPVEIIAQPLERMSVAMAGAKTSGGDFKSPVDFIVKPIAEYFVIVDRKSIDRVATGKLVCKEDTSFLKGGVFEDTDLGDGSVAAIVICIGLVFLISALVALVKMLSKLFLGPTRRVIAKMLNFNGYINILLGTAVTFAVHSSTLITSTLTPMAGLGVITLEHVYPIVIGSNLGTTGTALLASLVTGKSDSVAIALVHFWFNVLGIFMFYPIPITRKPILSWARSLARFSACWPMSAVLFLVMLFLVAPGVLLVLTYMCLSDGTTTMVFGYILSALVVLACAGAAFWYFKKGGSEKWNAFLERKREERERAEAEARENEGAEAHADGKSVV